MCSRLLFRGGHTAATCLACILWVLLLLVARRLGRMRVTHLRCALVDAAWTTCLAWLHHVLLHLRLHSGLSHHAGSLLGLHLLHHLWISITLGLLGLRKHGAVSRLSLRALDVLYLLGCHAVWRRASVHATLSLSILPL